MSRNLETRLAKLETERLPPEQQRVFQIVVHNNEERALEIDRLIAEEGFDEERDFLIVRTIVTPMERTL